MTKLLKYGLPLLAAVALGFGAATTARLAPTIEIADPVVAPAQPNHELRPIVFGTGLIEPKDGVVSVSSAISATVVEIPVVAGQRVQKGDPLMILDDGECSKEVRIRECALRTKRAELARLKAGTHPSQIHAAEKNVEASRVNVARAQDAFRRVQGLAKQSAVSQEESQLRRFALDAAEAESGHAQAELTRLKTEPRPEDVAVLEGEIELASAQLERAQVDLSRCVIRSPLDAVVLKVNARVGEYLSTAFSSVPAFMLGEEAPLRVSVQVDEEEAGRVDSGCSAEAVLRGGRGERLELRFVRIEPYVLPKRSSSGHQAERLDTRTLTILYELASPLPTLYVGQQADVFIAVRDRACLSQIKAPSPQRVSE